MSNKEFDLSVQVRSKEENIKNLIDSGFIPAIVYGHGFENKMVKVLQSDFAKVYGQAGESHLINLKIDDAAPVKVIVKDSTKANLKNLFTHVDFFKVSMQEKMTTELELRFVGESKAVKDLGGTLMKAINHLEIRCLPGDLMDYIEVDISGLDTFDDNIKVSDLKISKGIEIMSQEPEAIVAFVAEAKAEVEEPAAPAAATPAPAEPETPKK